MTRFALAMHTQPHGAGLLLTGNAGTGKTLAAKSLFANPTHPQGSETMRVAVPAGYLFELHSGEHLTRLDNWEPTEGGRKCVAGRCRRRGDRG